MAKSVKNNPWQREGVSILPKEPKDLMPIVGQKRLFDMLSRFRETLLTPSANKLSGFFVLHGGWGVGKSRVGHEVCLEAISEDVDWIVEGQPQRLLRGGLQDHILPLFLRYIQVTGGPLGEHLGADNWIASVVVEGLGRLAGLRAHDTAGNLARNQDRIRQWTEMALRPKGWERAKPALAAALGQRDVQKAARGALEALKEHVRIEHLWLVVDEIEDITDVELDGLHSEERKSIDQGLLTMIPRVIKAEEVRQEYPEVNFLLLCSLAVGDLLKQVRAIERRTERLELRTNAFTDVEAFFTYLQNHRPAVAVAISDYPQGLKEAAFFAANRNFGWFNVIMHHCHENHQGGKIPAWDLLRRFGEDTSRGRDSVFIPETIGEYRVEHDDDYSFVREAMYGMLPHRIGAAGGVDGAKATRLLAKRDHGGTQRNIFTKMLEIQPPPLHRITVYMVKSGFENETGTVLAMRGEVRFDLKEVIESLKAYSAIVLPEDRRDHLLICEDKAEFTAQVKGLSPYAEQAEHFADVLHGLLTEPAYRAKDDSGNPPEYVAPAFTFLFEFNRLNRLRRGEEGFLRDSASNTRLEEAFREVQKDAKGREQTLLHGLANCWDIERAPVQVTPVSECSLTALSFTSSYSPLDLGTDHSAIVFCGTSATDAEIEQDLSRIVSRRSLEPVVIVLEDQDQRVEDLAERIARNVSRIAPFVVIHNITRQGGDYLVRVGLMGEAFASDDLRTSHFHAVIQLGREQLKKILDLWLKEKIEDEGLVLRPLFYGSKVLDDDLAAFAKGYTALLGGKSYHEITQSGSGVFDDDTERERFTKMADRQVAPGAKYQGAPRMELLVDEAGARQAELPRCILTLMSLCSHVQLKPADLERRFLFAVPDDVRAREVVRHFVGVLVDAGLIERLENDAVRQISEHSLSTELKAAEDWLDTKFEAATAAIKAIYHDEGTRLADLRGKQARQSLKEARQRLEELDLDFVGKAWEELNRMSSDGIPMYEQCLRKSLAVISKVRDEVRRIYDAAAERAFRYSPEVLLDFEQNQSSPGYPLWKRVKVLQGFYADVDKKRRELLKRIGEVLQDVERRVPDLPEGQKAFPTQALSRPLSAFRQELDFRPDRPNKTVTAGGSSFGVVTVGYKICDNRYREALERLGHLEAELSLPGKLVAGFLELLSTWEGLRTELVGIRSRLDAVRAFFADAPAKVKSEAGLEDNESEFDELTYQINGGGIRHNTDEREEANAPVLSLVDGLKTDMDKLRTQPRDLADHLEGLESQAVQSLEVAYQAKHRNLMRAWTSIRVAVRKDPRTWPQQRAETYGKTQAAFDGLVAEMRAEGERYFAGEPDTTLDVYVALCGMELDEQPIDWDSPEYERHVTSLKRKKLLELRLR